jgi:hypothetical protein
MKVFDLVCGSGHHFEGWFDSSEAFESQQARGLVECPMCADASITRRPSAPRLNLSAASAHPPVPPAAQTAATLQRAWLELARHIRENTEDVGDRFADEARRIHYREAPPRGIRGVASRDESLALAEEGIEVMAFPMPVAAKDPLQ